MMALIYLWNWRHCTNYATSSSFTSWHVYAIWKCRLHVSVIYILHVCFTFNVRCYNIRTILGRALGGSIIDVEIISCYIRHVGEVMEARNVWHLRWQGWDHRLLIITLVLLLLIKCIILWVWAISENALIHRFKLLKLKFSVTRRFTRISLIHHVHTLTRIISICFPTFIHSGTVATWLRIRCSILLFLLACVVTSHYQLFHVECLTLSYIYIDIDINW